jgi:hypothetical protein
MQVLLQALVQSANVHQLSGEIKLIVPVCTIVIISFSFMCLMIGLKNGTEWFLYMKSLFHKKREIVRSKRK